MQTDKLKAGVVKLSDGQARQAMASSLSVCICSRFFRGHHLGDAALDLLQHLQLTLIAVVERVSRILSAVERLARLPREAIEAQAFVAVAK